jgi:hypothetical protein
MRASFSSIGERRLAEGARAGVDGERLVEVAQDIDVGDDEPVVLAGEDAVGPGNGLHQGLVAHRLVEVDRRARGDIEPGRPHRAGERDVELVLRVQ